MGVYCSVREHLRQTAMRWKMLLLLRHLSILVMIGLLATLLIGCLMYRGWFTSAMVPALLFAVITGFLLLMMLVALVTTVDKRTDDVLLASALEQCNQPLLDRVNTLVYLRTQGDPRAQGLQALIEQQAVDILREPTATYPFPWKKVWLHVSALSLLLILTIAFYGTFQPWRFVGVAADDKSRVAAEKDLQLPPADSSSTEDDDPLNREPWTDVRITEPGRDMRVTRHEVIPLRIEAASNRNLTNVEWFSSVNGGPPEHHALIAPDDPRYAVYETMLLLEDYQLQTWDVLAYFARATTAEGTTHDSEVYFIELFPYRDELQELPGGEEGQVVDQLQELTELVQRQQEVIRQTQLASGRDREQRESKARKQLFDSLAAEEAQLRQDLQFLEAALRSRVDDETLEPLGQSLEQTRQSLEAAEQNLRERDSIQALDNERKALAELVQLRKDFQQLVNDNPQAFQPHPLEQLADRTDRIPPAEAESSEQTSENTLPQGRLLEQRLRDNARQYEPIERGPESAPESAIAEATRETRRLAEELAELKERMPDWTQDSQPEEDTNASPDRQRNPFQPAAPPDPLMQKLQSDALRQLDSKCDQLGQSSNPGMRKQLASDIREQLQQLADAVAASRSGRLEQLAQRQAQQLEQMQAQREQFQNAREFLRDTLQDQRDLQRSVPQRPNAPLNDQAQKQLALQQSLEDYIRQNPEPFQNTAPQQREAKAAMRQAAQAMQQRSPAARQKASQAAEAVQRLDDALDQQHQRDQLTDAAKLEKMLQRQVEQLRQFEQNPESVSSGQCQQAASQAQSAAGELQQLAQNSSPSSPLGSQLQNAISEEAKQKIDAAAERLSQSQTPGEMQQSARELREQLQPLADLLSQCLGQQPGGASSQRPGQASRRALQPDGQRAIERGMRQIDSIARRQQLRRATPQSQQQLSREALQSFSDGISGLYGHNEQTQPMLQRMRDKLEERVTPVDQATLEELVQLVQSLRREALIERPGPERVEELRGINPESVAPEYREWVRRYFEELSRQP